ncbi:MAG: hypothetical protein A2735_01070 [Candidatus Yanofskybacteria bacterium RIFCSPHIGHO2_01_FULL_41_21]|uniref:Response regulatory domain-containing protein n=1 Tax=Candidatus Yanofskybacteria bacterium RIFCSPHIGHO2_01_FULL_41_21 TaxID=1802660 RepID=A0A1F8ECK9_9BACT|nr:MAG: hypothetical protein A2735_01070 [Candidatus Yanofskybacteria bacterium RIFCSPHIGHO2_01_FULL_41_21]
MRILVADDNELIRKFMAKFLREKGFGVVEASDGLEALIKIFEQPSYDLLWTDFDMPKMNGIELATKVRTIWRDLPIVLYSGNVPEKIDPKIITIVLNKPAHNHQILETVEGLLKIHSN